MIDDNKTMSDLINKSGLTPASMARALGVSKNTMYSYCTRSVIPPERMAKAQAIADVMSAIIDGSLDPVTIQLALKCVQTLKK